MSRKLILASAITMVMAGTDVSALGLGGLRTQSALNQPFSAEIELRDVNPDELDAVSVSLASPEAFSKAKLERYYYLTRLSFSPGVTPQGKPVIRISSREPIREPYMDFLVEVVWPSGKLLKEYTLLLDPPSSSARMAPNVQAPQAGSTGRQSTGVARAAASSGNYLPAPGDGFPVYAGPVGNGSGLWALARSHTPAGASVAQTAMAFYRNNQNAFIRGNINRLIAGKTLVIPSRAELFALDAAEAEREYAAALRGRAARRAPLTDVSPETLSRLRVAGAAPSRGAPSATGTTAQGLPSPASASDQQDLLLALETSESTRQETVELRGRIKELETQLADIQRLLQLRNAELARAQSTEGAAVAPIGQLPGQTQAPPPAEAEVALEPVQPPQVAAEAATATPADSGEPIIAPPGEGTETPSETAATLESETAEAVDAINSLEAALKAEESEPAPGLVPVPTPEPLAADTPTETVAPVAPPPVTPPPAVVAPPEPESAWSSLLLPLGALAGVAVLGILAFSWISARRRREEEEAEALEYESGNEVLFEPLDATTEPRTSTVTEERETAVTLSKKADKPILAEPVSTQTKDIGFDSGMNMMSSLSSFDAETDEADVLSEADIYIAYGRHNEAQELLRNELQRSPERLDIRYKLAESLAAAKDLDALSEVLAEIQAAGGDTREPAQWQRMQGFLGQIQSAPAQAPPVLAAEADFERPPERGGEDFLGLDLGDSFSLDVSDIQRPSERPAGLDLLADIDSDAGASPRIGDSGLDDLVFESRQGDDFDRDSFGDALTVASDHGGDRESELELTLDEHKVEDVDDLDSIFDSTLPDQPTLARNEMLGGRASGPGGLDLISTTGLDSSEPGLAPEQESVPTDLLSSQWQIDSGIWDETATKLDLARAYIEMEDKEAAREILEEVISEGRDEQRSEAQSMLDKLV